MDTEDTAGRRIRGIFREVSRTVEEARRSVVAVRNGSRGVGAGVILAASGPVVTNAVVTNAHVVAGSRRSRRRGERITIALHDGRELEAKVERSDPGLDLALLRPEGEVPDGLTAVRFGDPDALRVGELVFAVGHPRGRAGAVTAGVLGDRPRGGPGRGPAYIRSDVALAPGNSGGPLLNAAGEVVGINAMISGGAAISIPADVVGAWLAETPGRRPERHPERRPEPRLGIGVLPVARATGPALVIAAVEAGGPAGKAGLIVGDVLLAAGERPLRSPRDLLAATGEIAGPVLLEVSRGGEVFFVRVEPGFSSPGPQRAA